MIHCHNTLHADAGMIQKEYVRNVTIPADAATCVCNSFQPISGIGIIDDVEQATILIGTEQQHHQQGTLSTTSSGRRFCFSSRSTITTGLLVLVVLVLQ